MKFSTQQDIDAPIAAVFAMLCDFDALEAAVSSRGADVKRLDALPHHGVGTKWGACVDLGGRPREVEVEITAFDPPDGIGAELLSQGLQGDTRLDLVAISTDKTRVIFEAELRAKSMAARVLLQPLKLAKPSLDRRFEDRVAQYLDDMKRRYDQGTA